MNFRTATARGKAEQADMAADHAREDSDIAQATAKQFAPDFKQPGLDRIKTREPYRVKTVPEEPIQQMPLKQIPHNQQNDVSVNQISNQVPSHNHPNLPTKPQQNTVQQNTTYNKKPEMNQINQIPNQIQSPTNVQPNLTNVPRQSMDQIDQNQNHHEVISQNQIRKSNQSLNRIPHNPDSNPYPNNPSNPSIRRSSKVFIIIYY